MTIPIITPKAKEFSTSLNPSTFSTLGPQENISNNFLSQTSPLKEDTDSFVSEGNLQEPYVSPFDEVISNISNEEYTEEGLIFLLIALLLAETEKDENEEEQKRDAFRDIWTYLQPRTLGETASSPYVSRGSKKQRSSSDGDYSTRYELDYPSSGFGKKANLDSIFKKYGQYIDKAAKTYNLDPKLIALVIWAESSGNPKAVSHCGAQGLMQLMSATARGLSVKDSFNPEQNIMGGSKYLRSLLDRFSGNQTLAVASYNCGPNRAEKFARGTRQLPEETRNYVAKIIGNLQDSYASGKTGDFRIPLLGRFRLTSGFGPRRRPRPGASTNHHGLDLAAPTGTGVVASNDGRVTFTGRRGSYGNLIIIDHGNGKTTRYGHLSSINVSRGQVVAKGEKIGEVGSTGVSTGPHLHFEVRVNGIARNPGPTIGIG